MKLALLGLKGHQNVVLEGARQLGDVELVAIAADDEAGIAALRESEPLAKQSQAFADWRRMLDHSTFDVCCLCDENGVRAEQLIALAEAGVHVVSEKPLTTTLDDLESVRQAWAAARGRLTMLLTMRHEPKYAALRDAITQGLIGEPCQMSAQKSYRLGVRPDWFRSQERLGGIVPYIGIHALDMMHWVTGLDYTHVSALHGRQGKRDIMGETESHASLLLRAGNGASVSARLDYLRPESAPTHGDDRLRVAGTSGVVECRADNPNVMITTAERGPYEIAPQPVKNLFVAFSEAVRNGQPPPISTEDCLYATSVVLQARLAADENRVVELADRS